MLDKQDWHAVIVFDVLQMCQAPKLPFFPHSKQGLYEPCFWQRGCPPVDLSGTVK